MTIINSVTGGGSSLTTSKAIFGRYRDAEGNWQEGNVRFSGIGTLNPKNEPGVDAFTSVEGLAIGDAYITPYGGLVWEVNGSAQLMSGDWNDRKQEIVRAVASPDYDSEDMVMSLLPGIVSESITSPCETATWENMTTTDHWMTFPDGNNSAEPYTRAISVRYSTSKANLGTSDAPRYALEMYGEMVLGTSDLDRSNPWAWMCSTSDMISVDVSIDRDELYLRGPAQREFTISIGTKEDLGPFYGMPEDVDIPGTVWGWMWTYLVRTNGTDTKRQGPWFHKYYSEITTGGSFFSDDTMADAASSSGIRYRNSVAPRGDRWDGVFRVDSTTKRITFTFTDYPYNGYQEELTKLKYSVNGYTPDHWETRAVVNAFYIKNGVLE